MNNQVASNVLIMNTNMDWRTNKMQISYAIPALDIQGDITISNQEYIDAIQKGGFAGVSELVVDHILDYLDNLIGKPEATNANSNGKTVDSKDTNGETVVRGFTTGETK